MATPGLHTVFIPGLLCSARLYDPVLPTAWAHGAVTVADSRRDDTIHAMAARLLDDAPERFVLVGLSMGGYVAHEVMRLAPERVSGLALISTSARPDSAEQLENRQGQRQAVLDGRFDDRRSRRPGAPRGLGPAGSGGRTDPLSAARSEVQRDARAERRRRRGVPPDRNRSAGY